MILITGGLGFIGVGLTRYLLEQGKEVLITRRRTSRIPASLKKDLDKKLQVADCDILDLPNLVGVLKKYHVASIVHAANVTANETSLYQAFKANVEGTVNVLEAARLMDIKRITFLSSVTVYYGIKGEARYHEAMAIPLDSRHPIGSEKAAAEATAHHYASHYNLDVMIVRPSMVYGPYSASVFAPLQLMVDGVVREKRAVLPRAHPEFRTDFIHIDDCSWALGTVHLAKEPKCRVYNIASGERHSLNEVADMIKKIVPGCHIELRGAPSPWSPAGIDVSRLANEFGYKPKYTLEAGIRQYIDWINRGRG